MHHEIRIKGMCCNLRERSCLKREGAATYGKRVAPNKGKELQLTEKELLIKGKELMLRGRDCN